MFVKFDQSLRWAEQSRWAILYDLRGAVNPGLCANPVFGFLGLSVGRFRGRHRSVGGKGPYELFGGKGSVPY